MKIYATTTMRKFCNYSRFNAALVWTFYTQKIYMMIWTFTSIFLQRLKIPEIYIYRIKKIITAENLYIFDDMLIWRLRPFRVIRSSLLAQINMSPCVKSTPRFWGRYTSTDDVNSYVRNSPNVHWNCVKVDDVNADDAFTFAVNIPHRMPFAWISFFISFESLIQIIWLHLWCIIL